MKTIMLKIAAFTISVLVVWGCNRDDSTSNIGGKGGNATLKVTPQHHTLNIDSCMIYIKYNATNTPDSYDDSAMCVPQDGAPVATFTQLKKGNYYLYGKGWDPSIVQSVKGGLTYEITQEQTIHIFLPVTEPH